MNIMGRLKHLNNDQLQKIDSKMSNISTKFDVTDEDMKQYLQKKIDQNKTAFDQQVKNIKPIVMNEAVEFLKEQTNALVKVLTKTHHQLIKNFLEFRARNEDMRNER